jgi:hypothetical protein
MTFVEAALDIETHLKTLSPDQKQERRRAQWRRYNCSGKGQGRVERYRDTVPGILAREQARLNERRKDHAR